MVKVKHRKGKRLVNIFLTIYCLWKSFFVKKIVLCFSENSKYDINNQYQWNKIIGRGSLNYDFKSNQHKESRMIVWRYNKKLNVFQIAEYKRKNYIFVYNIVSNLKVNQKAEFVCKFRGIKPLAFYFGGQDKPNKDIEYLIRFK